MQCIDFDFQEYPLSVINCIVLLHFRQLEQVIMRLRSGEPKSYIIIKYHVYPGRLPPYFYIILPYLPLLS